MSTEIDTSKVSYQGYIEKIGGNVHTWKRRYFAIVETTLYYFKDTEFKEKLGTIPLIDTSVTDEEATEGPGFYFMVRFPPSSGAARTEYLFRTPTSDEREKWKSEILKANIITVFNRPLVTALKINPSQRDFYLPIPYFFVKGINYLNANALDVEGIYRLNGSGAQIEALQNKINNNLDIEFTDPHVATGLIKLYMRTLPEPLLLRSNYLSLKQIIALPEAKQAEALKPVLRGIPIANYVLIHYLFAHLNELLKHEDNTKMNFRALAVCIGPSLITGDDESSSGAYGESNVQQSVCTIFFQHFDELFGPNPLLIYGSNGNGNIYRVTKVCANPDYPFILKAEHGDIIQAISEDRDGWMICVFNDQWGVVHKTQLSPVQSPVEIVKGLSLQNSKWDIPSDLMNKMAEKCPESVQLYEVLIAKLRDLRSRGKMVQ